MTAPGDERAPLSRLRHDLRTPINQIIGYGELLREEAADAGHHSYDADLGKIVRAARDLLGLIDVNLTEARMPGGPPGAASAPASPDAAPAADGGARESEAAVNPGRILVVDDNEGNRDMLSRQLTRQGHSVATAENGRVALERLRAEPFDLALLDMLMPELDGYGALLEIRGDPALRHLPVIMISALDEIGSVVRCIERGAEDYLPKPSNPVLLRARIGAALDKKRFRDHEQLYLKRIEETQARLKQELTDAENYIRSILPAPRPAPIATDWRLIPSTELGGDSFGYHWIDDGHFALYLLDVCGHGVGAALLSVAAINVVRTGALAGVNFRDPGATLTALNEAFPMEKQNDMYFTIWYGVWETSTRTLRFASAGHPPALLAAAAPGGGTTTDPLKGNGPVLGGLPGIIYRTFDRRIPRDSRLYLLSDGTYEITRPDGSMWSFEEFCAFLAPVPKPGESELDRLFAHVKALHGPGALDDDFSVVRFEL